MSYRLFGQLNSGDTVFYISPVTLNATPVTIIHFAPSATHADYIVMRVIRNMQYKSKLITDATLQDAKDEHGTKIHQDLIIPKKLSSVLLSQNPPTILFTSEEELLAWQKATQ